MKIVLDTNVLLAGMFTRGVCEALLDHCQGNSQHALFISKHILDEFAEHAGKFHAPAADIRQVVQWLKGQMIVVEPLSVPPLACRDPVDLPVLGTLLAAGAQCLVSGDKDLLVLKSFSGLPIYSPRELYNLLQSHLES